MKTRIIGATAVAALTLGVATGSANVQTTHVMPADRATCKIPKQTVQKFRQQLKAERAKTAKLRLALKKGE